MGKKQIVEESAGGDIGNQIFGDLMSQMLTFFILLYIFAAANQSKTETDSDAKELAAMIRDGFREKLNIEDKKEEKKPDDTQSAERFESRIARMMQEKTEYERLQEVLAERLGEIEEEEKKIEQMHIKLQDQAKKLAENDKLLGQQQILLNKKLEQVQKEERQKQQKDLSKQQKKVKEELAKVMAIQQQLLKEQERVQIQKQKLLDDQIKNQVDQQQLLLEKQALLLEQNNYQKMAQQAELDDIKKGFTKMNSRLSENVVILRSTADISQGQLIDIFRNYDVILDVQKSHYKMLQDQKIKLDQQSVQLNQQKVQMEKQKLQLNTQLVEVSQSLQTALSKNATETEINELETIKTKLESQKKQLADQTQHLAGQLLLQNAQENRLSYLKNVQDEQKTLLAKNVRLLDPTRILIKNAENITPLQESFEELSLNIREHVLSLQKSSENMQENQSILHDQEQWLASQNIAALFRSVTFDALTLDKDYESRLANLQSLNRQFRRQQQELLNEEQSFREKETDLRQLQKKLSRQETYLREQLKLNLPGYVKRKLEAQLAQLDLVQNQLLDEQDLILQKIEFIEDSKQSIASNLQNTSQLMANLIGKRREVLKEKASQLMSLDDRSRFIKRSNQTLDQQDNRLKNSDKDLISEISALENTRSRLERTLNGLQEKWKVISRDPVEAPALKSEMTQIKDQLLNVIQGHQQQLKQINQKLLDQRQNQMDLQGEITQAKADLEQRKQLHETDLRLLAEQLLHVDLATFHQLNHRRKLEEQDLKDLLRQEKDIDKLQIRQAEIQHRQTEQINSLTKTLGDINRSRQSLLDEKITQALETDQQKIMDQQEIYLLGLETKLADSAQDISKNQASDEKIISYNLAIVQASSEEAAKLLHKQMNALISDQQDQVIRLEQRLLGTKENYIHQFSQHEQIRKDLQEKQNLLQEQRLLLETKESLSPTFSALTSLTKKAFLDTQQKRLDHQLDQLDSQALHFAENSQIIKDQEKQLASLRKNLESQLQWLLVDQEEQAVIIRGRQEYFAEQEKQLDRQDVQIEGDMPLAIRELFLQRQKQFQVQRDLDLQQKLFNDQKEMIQDQLLKLNSFDTQQQLLSKMQKIVENQDDLDRQNAKLEAQKTHLDQQLMVVQERMNSKKELNSVELKIIEKVELVQEIRKIVEEENLNEYIDVIVEEEKIRLIFKQPVLFNSGSANLKFTSQKYISPVAQIIQKIPNEIVVEGHTDNIPIHNRNFESNWDLSFYRAYSVLKYLVHKEKISAKRISAIGYGEYRPRKDNTTEENRAFNRRIEVNIITKKTTGK